MKKQYVLGVLVWALGCYPESFVEDMKQSAKGMVCSPEKEPVHCEGEKIVGCAKGGGKSLGNSLLNRDCSQEKMLCLSPELGQAECVQDKTPCDPATFQTQCKDGLKITCTLELGGKTYPFAASLYEGESCP